MQARRKLVSSLSGVAWTVRSLLLLSSCSARKRTELMWTWSLPSRQTAHEEVFWSLAVLVVVLLMRRLLMRVFSAGLRSSYHPWAEAGPLKGPRSRWTRIPWYPEHRQWALTKSFAGPSSRDDKGPIIPASNVTTSSLPTIYASLYNHGCPACGSSWSSSACTSPMNSSP
jgi:hypothetical protein